MHLKTIDENDEEALLGEGNEEKKQHKHKKKRTPEDDEERVRAMKKHSFFRDYVWEMGVKPVVCFLIVMGLVVFSAYYCTPCFWGIIGLCACTCIGAPLMNIPLWISVALLVWNGGVVKLTFGIF